MGACLLGRLDRHRLSTLATHHGFLLLGYYKKELVVFEKVEEAEFVPALAR